MATKSLSIATSQKRSPRQLCHELNSKRNNSAQVVVADLGDNEAIKKLTQTIKSLDLLVNNASVFYPTSTENSTIEDWDKIININLRAPFFITTGLSKVLETKSRKYCQHY